MATTILALPPMLFCVMEENFDGKGPRPEMDKYDGTGNAAANR